jgi:hypothetical protein
MLVCGAVSSSFVLYAGAASADMAAAKKWVDEEFQPSTLSKDQQMKEMEWFIHAAAPYKGMSIKVVSETIPTHAYEAKTLAAAFEEITGIHVTHDVIQEGDVVEKLQTQVQTGKAIYDAYINDDDFIGFHARYPYTRNLTDWMANEGKDVTNPNLDLEDFLGLADATGLQSRGFDGKLWQLPDQSFINVYWFRKDWFDRADLKEAFKKKYGYELGVPVNWSAYEDIAQFFKDDVKEIDGKACPATWTTARRPRSRLALHRRLAGNGRRGRRRRTERLSGRRVGHPHGRLPAGWLQRDPRRGRQWPGRAVRASQVHRVAAYIRPARRARHGLLSVPAQPRERQRGAAGLLVLGVCRQHARTKEQGQQHGGPGRQAPLADGADASWSVLEAGHEGRLSGRRLLDAPQGRSS